MGALETEGSQRSQMATVRWMPNFLWKLLQNLPLFDERDEQEHCYGGGVRGLAVDMALARGYPGACGFSMVLASTGAWLHPAPQMLP